MQWCTMLSSRHRPCVSVNESAGLAVHHSSSRRHRQNNANAMYFIQIERERERENNGLAAFVFCSWFVIRVSWSIEFVSCYYCCCCCGCRRAHTAVSMHFLQNNSRARALLPWTGARAMRKCFDCRVVCGVHGTRLRVSSLQCVCLFLTLYIMEHRNFLWKKIILTAKRCANKEKKNVRQRNGLSWQPLTNSRALVALMVFHTLNISFFHLLTFFCIFGFNWSAVWICAAIQCDDLRHNWANHFCTSNSLYLLGD